MSKVGEKKQQFHINGKKGFGKKEQYGIEYTGERERERERDPKTARHKSKTKAGLILTQQLLTVLI